MIRSLRKKFILVNMLLVFTVLIAVFTALCITTYNRQVAQTNMVLRMALDRRDDQRPPTFEIGKEPPKDFNRDPVLVLKLREDGVEILRADNISLTQEEAEVLAQTALESGKEQGVLRGYNLRFLVGEAHGVVRIAFIDLYGERLTLRNTILASALSLAAALAAFFLISLFLSKWVLRPVEQAWEQQRRFVADASHELKTPLTVILANMGILLANREDTVERQAGWVESTQVEANRMKKLVDELLFLAKTDEGKAPVVLSRVNLSDLVAGTALTFEPVAYERGLTLETQVAEQVFVEGDDSQLTRLVSILADNAVKYSAPQGAVTLALAARQGKALLSVHNRGKALAPEEMARLFQRFYRADPSRTTEGYGLGLAIAKSIAEQHGGKITVESAAGQGTTFYVSLPLSL